MHWTKGEEEEDDINYWYRPYHGPPSGDIEMTAYALLTYIKMGDIPGAARIAKWMTHQRGAFGGYGSTQVRWFLLMPFMSIFFKREGCGSSLGHQNIFFVGWPKSLQDAKRMFSSHG